MSKRMRLEDDGYHVTISYDDEGERVTRTFWAPTKFGYVQEVMRSGDHRQVCDGLYSTGSTLMASSDTLASVIRREYSARKRAEGRWGL